MQYKYFLFVFEETKRSSFLNHDVFLSVNRPIAFILANRADSGEISSRSSLFDKVPVYGYPV